MSGVSGKKTILLLYGSAILLCGGLLWYGKVRTAKTPGIDGVPTIEAMTLLRTLPAEWTQITFVEGQGWAVYVPCGAPAATLQLETGDERPQFICNDCDSLAGARILGLASDGLAGTPEPGKIRLDVDQGQVTIETVDAAVAARFPDAALRDYLLTWKLSDSHARYFVPTLKADGFETLRAEDESPEGCLTE